MPPAENFTMYLGVVIYTTEPFVSAPGNKDHLILDKISLVPNDFAVESPPKAFDQVIEECQFYYEKSYDQGTLAGVASDVSALRRSQTAAWNDNLTNVWFSASFQFEYNTVKRGIPAIVTYNSFNGTANEARVNCYNTGALVVTADPSTAASTNWTRFVGTKSVLFAANNGLQYGALAQGLQAFNNSAEVRFNYTADARLGI